MTKKLKYAGKWWIPKRYIIYREYHDGMFDYDNEVWTWNTPVYFGFAVINESPNKKESYASHLINDLSKY